MTRLDPVLQDRDPVLAAAVAAHGAELRFDLQPRLILKRNDARRLPGVEVSIHGHRIEWRCGTGRVVLVAKWEENDGRGREARWDVELHTDTMPEAIAIALRGRQLDAIIDVEGADAWEVTNATTTEGFGAIVSLGRRH